MTPEQDDLARLRIEYSRREQRLAGSDLYSFSNPAYLFAVQQRQRVMLKALRAGGCADLEGRRILEVGCGSGRVLAELAYLGAQPAHLAGVDLLHRRLVEAHRNIPGGSFTAADGQNLPCPPHSFDLVLQFTAFSSVLDEQVKRNMAAEMLRVLKPGGAIIWYDFWLNPANRQTRGIRPGEIRALFPGCAVDLHKTTLAPPIARRIVPVSWGLAVFLEALQVLNSHYLALIRKVEG